MSGALTRILNNQIYNQTIIASQKIAAGTITGTLFASNITVPGDILITGNLMVLGSSQQTTVASTNTYVNDPLIVLNNGFSGTNTYDEGLVFNRGSATNQAFIWSEVFKEFRLVATSETGTTYGNVNASGLANLAVNNFFATGTTTINNVVVSTLAVSGNVIGGLAQFASINSTPIGNATPASGNFTYAIAGNVLSGFIGNAGSIHTGLTAQFSGNVIGGLAQFAAINATPIGNATPSTGNFTYAIAGNVLSGFIGNTGTVYNGASLNVTGNVLATSATFAAANVNGLINSTVISVSNILVGAGGLNSNATVFAVGFNTTGNLLASTVGASFVTAQTAAVGNISAVTIGNSGATVTGTTAAFSGNVIGGLAQFAAINSTPIGNATASTAAFTTLSASQAVTFNYGTNSTSATSGGTMTITGGASISQDLWVGGNIYAANIIGTQANVITVENPLLYLATTNDYPYNYDIGFYSHFIGTGLATTANVYQHTGVIRDFTDNTWKFVSNVQTEPSGDILTLNASTVYDPIKAGNLSLVTNIPSTSTSTGALIVAGGAGIGGNLVAGQLNSTGNVLGQAATFNALTVNGNESVTGYLNVTGNILGSAVTFSSSQINGNESVTGYVNITGNVLAAVGVFGGVQTTGTTYSNSSQAVSGISTSVGALVVPNGGAAIGGALNLGGQAQIGVASANYVQVVGASTGGYGVVRAAGEAGTGLVLGAGGTGNIAFNGATSASVGTATNFLVYNAVQAGSTNYLTVAGTAAGGSPVLGVAGTDTNANIIISPRGTGNVTITATNASTSTTTGALTVAGGVGVAGAVSAQTLRVTGNVIGGLGQFAAINSTPIGNATPASGAFTSVSATTTGTFNSSQGTNVFQVLGAVDTALFTVTPGIDSVVIGGQGNTNPQWGTAAKFGGTGGIVLPTGTSSQRPSNSGNVDLVGMVRYNTTYNNLEFCTASGLPGTWAVAGSNYTVISDRQFSGNVGGGYGNVDGTNTTFILQDSGSTSSTIVSINGVMQFPVLAYSVSGNVLTFTEPPAPTDVIDVRLLTTTATVTTLASGNGYNQVIVDTTGTSIWTGVGATFEQILVDPVGNFNFLKGSHITYTQSNVNVTSTATATLIDTFSQTSYSTAKYIIQAKVNGTNNFESYEALAMTDQQGNAYITVYGVVNNGTTFGTITANVLAGNVRVYYTSTIAQANVKAFGTYIV